MEKLRQFEVLGELFSLGKLKKLTLYKLTEEIDGSFELNNSDDMHSKMDVLQVLPSKAKNHLLTKFYEGKLVKNKFFEGCDREFIALVAPKLVLMTFKQGEFVYTKDQPPIHGIHLI